MCGRSVGRSVCAPLLGPIVIFPPRKLAHITARAASGEKKRFPRNLIRGRK